MIIMNNIRSHTPNIESISLRRYFLFLTRKTEFFCSFKMYKRKWFAIVLLALSSSHAISEFVLCRVEDCGDGSTGVLSCSTACSAGTNKNASCSDVPPSHLENPKQECIDVIRSIDPMLENSESFNRVNNSGSILDGRSILEQGGEVLVVFVPGGQHTDDGFPLALRNNLVDANFEKITSSNLTSYGDVNTGMWAVESAQIIENDTIFSGHSSFEGKQMLCLNNSGGVISQVRQDIDLTPYLTEVSQGRVSVRASGYVASTDLGAELTIRSIPRVGIQGVVSMGGEVNNKVTLLNAGWQILSLPETIIPIDATSLELQFSAKNTTIPNGACIDAVTQFVLIDNQVSIATLPPSTLSIGTNEELFFSSEKYSNEYLPSVPLWAPNPSSDFTLGYLKAQNFSSSVSLNDSITGYQFLDISTSALNFVPLNDDLTCNIGSSPAVQPDGSASCVVDPFYRVPLTNWLGIAALSTLLISIRAIRH